MPLRQRGPRRPRYGSSQPISATFVSSTHDREWYSELGAHLLAKSWKFKRPQPWSNPREGSRWSVLAALSTIPGSSGYQARGCRQRSPQDREYGSTKGAEKLDVIKLWNRGLGLFESWENRAAHGGGLTKAEAEELIATCEKALEGLRALPAGMGLDLRSEKPRPATMPVRRTAREFCVIFETPHSQLIRSNKSSQTYWISLPDNRNSKRSASRASCAI